MKKIINYENSVRNNVKLEKYTIKQIKIILQAIIMRIQFLPIFAFHVLTKFEIFLMMVNLIFLLAAYVFGQISCNYLWTFSFACL